MRKVQFTLLIAALVASVLASSASAADFKVGFVLMDEIRQNGQPYKDALQRLQQVSQQRQQEAQQRLGEIERMRETLQRQASLMTEQRRQQQEMQIQQKLAEYEQWAGQAAGDLQKQQLEAIQPIDERVIEIIRRIAAEQNYDMVLDGSAIAYLRNQEEYNLTEAVVLALNAQ